jgi:hypothetical protein
MQRGKHLVLAALAAGAVGLVLGFATGCSSGLQKPYQFEARSRPDASSVAIQALRDLDWAASPMEGNPNRIRSDWKPTGTRFGYAGGRPAQLIRRIIVDFTPDSGKMTVQVKIELLACSEVAMLAGDYRAGRDCNNVEDIRPVDQRDVDRIGAAVERALAQR